MMRRTRRRPERAASAVLIGAGGVQGRVGGRATDVFMELEDLPKQIVTVGGGYIAESMSLAGPVPRWGLAHG
jgi:hypothetical protein